VGAADNDGDHHGKVLPKLIVVYAWEEQRALDATIAVNGLFLASILVSAGLVAYMMTKGDQTQAYLHAMYAPGGRRARPAKDVRANVVASTPCVAPRQAHADVCADVGRRRRPRGVGAQQPDRPCPLP